MDWKNFISQYDLIYETPPSCWQGGFLLGNGSMGAIFYADRSLQWVVNKSNVIDGRTHGVREITPPDEAEQMVRDGASLRDFEDREMRASTLSGLGPKSCCLLNMDIGTALVANMRGAPPNVHSRLSLYDATLNLQLDKHLCHPHVESFVNANEDVLVIRASNISPLASYMTKLYFSRPYDIELPEPVLSCDNGRIVLKMSMPECGDYFAAVQVVTRESNAYRDDLLNKLRSKYRPSEIGQVNNEVAGRFGTISVTGDFDVFLTVVSGLECDDPLRQVHKRLDSVINQGYEQQKENHVSWWHDYWQKSWVELGDKGLEQLFYNSLYILGSTYRSNPMPGLLGFVYGPNTGPVQISPWAGDFHHDLNVQCPFFPVHMLNHSELFESYLDTYESFLPTARELASKIWGVSGAHFDIAFNSVGKSIFGGVGNYRFFFGGSYVALMHCLCWRYRRDVRQLEDRIYPFLKEVLEFYLNKMTKCEDGKYHLWPAHACELDIANVSDPVQIISMLRVCLETAIEAADILNDKNDCVNRWKDLLVNLPDYPTSVDAKGRLVVVDGAGIHPDHHVGQAGALHPVYPCGEVDQFSNYELIKLYNNTFDSGVEKTAEKSYAIDKEFYYKRAWQCFFRAMTALRLGKSEEFWSHYMPMYLRAYSKPNGMFSHDASVIVESCASEANLNNIPDKTLIDNGEKMPKFEPWHNGDGSTPNRSAKEYSISVIESTSDYLTMITETMLQSNNNMIRVFPAWPIERNAQFVNLIAEGNIAVSSKITAGKVEFIRLKSLRDKPVKIRILSPWTREIEMLLLDVSGEIVLAKDGMRNVCDINQKPSSYAGPAIGHGLHTI